MNVALTTHWESFIQQLIESGRYNNAGEVVWARLRQLAATEGEIFPPGSLRHLYAREKNAREARLTHRIPVPKPSEA